MKWEYLIEDEDVAIQSFSRLNELGDQEWELVTISKGIAFFKRPARLKDDDELTIFICSKKYQVKASDLNWKNIFWKWGK